VGSVRRLARLPRRHDVPRAHPAGHRSRHRRRCRHRRRGRARAGPAGGGRRGAGTLADSVVDEDLAA
jgi:hypothetical protein